MSNENQILIAESAENEKNYIHDQIIEYNARCVPFTQKINPLFINYVAKKSEKVIGGINACMYHWGIIFIDILWVDEAFRGTGIGSKLLKKVEEKAKENSCTLIHLDSFDFQAKDFYLKHEYEIFGVLENCPAGHKRYYFKKNL